MTVDEIVRKITDLNKLASSLRGLSQQYDHTLTVGEAEDIEEAAEAILDYVEELGRKKVV